MSSALENYLVRKNLVGAPMRPHLHIMKCPKTILGTNRPSPRPHVEEEPANENVLFVLNNYVLLQNIILSNFNTWQELKLLGAVSKPWGEVVRNKMSKDITPRYFYQHSNETAFEMKCNADFSAEPMYVIIFVTRSGVKIRHDCKNFPNNPCGKPNCTNKHKVLDYLDTRFCFPKKKVLLAHVCLKIAYSPPLVTLPPDVKPNEKLTFGFDFQKDPCLSGIYFPKIPGVSVLTINVSPKDANVEVHTMLLHRISNLLKVKTLKCLLVFKRDFRNLFIFQHLMDVIEAHGDEVPIALGGCSVDRSCSEKFNYTNSHHFQDSLFTFFLVDKESETPVEFDVYSKVFTQDYVVESDLVTEFKRISDIIPRREHSAALKLSCVGRQARAVKVEDALFRQHFPTTSFAGCYGQGEVGADCLPSLHPNLRVQYVHSYSSVFVMFFWGKLL